MYVRGNAILGETYITVTAETLEFSVCENRSRNFYQSRVSRHISVVS